MSSYQIAPGVATYLVGMDTDSHKTCTIETTDGSSVRWPESTPFLTCSQAGQAASSATLTATATGYVSFSIDTAGGTVTLEIAVCFQAVTVTLSKSAQDPYPIAIGVEDTCTVFVTGNKSTVTWTANIPSTSTLVTAIPFFNVSGPSALAGTQVVLTGTGSGTSSYVLTDDDNPKRSATINVSIGHLLVKGDDGQIYQVNAGAWAQAGTILAPPLPPAIQTAFQNLNTTGIGTWVQPANIPEAATGAAVGGGSRSDTFADDCTTCYVIDLSNIPVPNVVP